MASGGIDGEVKLWNTNGENVGSWSHMQIITALKSFKDDIGGKSRAYRIATAKLLIFLLTYYIPTLLVLICSFSPLPPLHC